MDWQQALAESITKIGNAAVDIAVYRETAGGVQGTSITPNIQQPTTPLQTAQLQANAQSALMQYAPWIIGAVALVFIGRKLFKG